MASTPCWVAVRMTLMTVPCVRPPRAVRLPPQTFLFTTAGRMPCSRPADRHAVSGVCTAGTGPARFRRSWSADGGRRRRVYQSTPAGRRALEGERSAWRDFSTAVTRPPAACVAGGESP